jgi:hypothetical protein
MCWGLAVYLLSVQLPTCMNSDIPRIDFCTSSMCCTPATSVDLGTRARVHATKIVSVQHVLHLREVPKHSLAEVGQLAIDRSLLLPAAVAKQWQRRTPSTHRAVSVPLGMLTEPELDRRWAKVKYTRSTIASVLLSHGLLKLYQQPRAYT